MRFMPRRLAPVYLVAALAAWGESAAISPDDYLEDVRFLASKELRGRWTGSPELEKAATFIADRFREFGLKPVDKHGYLQPYQVTTEAKLGKGNRFRFSDQGKRTTVAPEDFRPFNFSSAGKLAGSVIFAGYGITAPEYNYDDYAGLDVKGKVVLILRHEPQEYEEKSVFAGRIYTRHAQFSSKTSNAKMHGAAGVILISDRGNHKGETDELEKFGATGGPGDAGIPFVQVKAARLDEWFQASGKNLEDIQAAIDQDLKPRSFPFPPTIRVDVTLDLERAVRTVHNVVGYLPGTSGDEYVVLGAHYDHLGLGEQFSMAPSMAGTIHPGADDNASGTAGVIELARWFSRQPKQKRGILFLAFSGEEMGLLGSSHFVDNPSLPLGKAVAMINMDMIGRIRDGKVFVGGAGTGTNLRELIDRIAPRHKLNIDFSDTTGYGSSDHTSFTTKQVPVLFFFSGLHSDYHKPSDTWDKIESGAAVDLLRLIAELTDTLREIGERPLFVRAAAQPHGAAGGPSGGGGGYGPSFGSIPDFGGNTKGVKFADVREGSPAAKAGFQAGDVMVEFDGKPIGNLEDFTYVLRSKKPGDEVLVKVIRNGKPIEAKATLTERK